jgi:flagellar hook-basal body complex protein FliE
MDPISLSSLLAGPGLKISPATTGTDGADTTGAATTGAGGGGFGAMLENKMNQLADSLQQADSATQGVVSGQSGDITNVVTQVEKASLEMQVASQIRNKAVEAYQDLFRMQI